MRQFCKSNMKEYKSFWNENPEFSNWFLEQPEEKLRKWFQLPRQEVVERLKNQNYIFHQAFGTLLCGGKLVTFDFVTQYLSTFLILLIFVFFLVLEQVAHFEITGYEVDGRGDPEMEFERCLKFDRRGGFTLADIGSEKTKVSTSKGYHVQRNVFLSRRTLSLVDCLAFETQGIRWS